MQVCWKSAAITLLLNFSLISHGQGTEPSATSVPYRLLKSLSSSPLSGNWHLNGVNTFAMAERQLPFLSFAIEVDGNKISGQGGVLIGCENLWNEKGGGVTFTGEISPDGTFEFDDYTTTSDYQFSIHGTVPQSGDTSWQGTYTLKNPFSTEPNCIVHEFGAFTATKYPPFTGTYSGTLTGTGASLAVTVQITQGEPGRYSGIAIAIIPLGGQITVFGSPCFTRGTVTNRRGSLIEGDQFYLTFSMDDGALLHLYGDRFRKDSDESTIEDVHLSVEGGQCDREGGSGTLTR